MENTRIAMITCQCLAGDVRRNLDSVIRWTGQAKAAGAVVVCFPEMNISGYGLDFEGYEKAAALFDDVVDALSALAASEDITVLAGTVRKSPKADSFLPCHVVAHPDGGVETYGKLHIAPPEAVFFIPGDTVPLFNGPGVRFGIQLCYDAHFPELSTRMALDGADLIFFPHASPRGNSAQEKYDSWMRHLTARAFDNGLFVAACNQSGDNDAGLTFPGLAVVIGPDGKVIGKELAGDRMLMVDLSADELAAVRDHRMRYFLPNRRPDIYGSD
jgi:N-carbamoylputrescine amidase